MINTLTVQWATCPAFLSCKCSVCVNPPLLWYKFTRWVCEHSHSFNHVPLQLQPSGSDLWIYWMDMSDTVKPRTSFLIEDILSVKDSTSFNGKSSYQKMERCSQWEEEESEKLTEKLYAQETASGEHSGELQLHTNRNLTWTPKIMCIWYPK